jgi:hypothetical protein
MHLLQIQYTFDILTVWCLLIVIWRIRISLVGVSKKVVPLSKSAHVSVSSEFILQIKLILSSPVGVLNLTFN